MIMKFGRHVYFSYTKLMYYSAMNIFQKIQEKVKLQIFWDFIIFPISEKIVPNDNIYLQIFLNIIRFRK